MTKILVTGSTGRLGHAVVEHLLEKVDASSIAVLVRDTAKAEDFKAKGVDIRQGDYNDTVSLISAFKDIDKLFFVSANDFPNRLKQHENVVNAAKEAGVPHIVYTSFQRKREDEASPIHFVSEAHLNTEKWLKESGITYTILKNGLYPDIIPMFLGEKVLENGTIYVPTAEGKTAFAPISDLAAGSVEILTTPGHANKTYEFSAEFSWSFGEIAEMLTKISGKKITHVSPGNQEYKDALKSHGVPDMYIGLLAGFAEGIRTGEFDFPDATLSSFIGRSSFDLYEYLKAIYSKA